MIASLLTSALAAITLIAQPIARTMPVVPTTLQHTLESLPSLREPIDALAATPSEWPEIFGDNVAHYAGPPAIEQLFEIFEFTVAPHPPIPGHRFFGYLEGFMPYNEPDLDNSTLRFTLRKGNRTLSTIVTNLNSPYIFKRHGRDDHSDEIKKGYMEFFMDSLYAFAPGTEPGNYTYEAESELPDGRVLFDFEFTYEWKV